MKWLENSDSKKTLEKTYTFSEYKQKNFKFFFKILTRTPFSKFVRAAAALCVFFEAMFADR